MTIADMHYDFKKKLNKVDSQQNRNLLVPEIDWALNEAQELFIKWIAEPRTRSHFGVEKSQRTIDDIRTLVKSESITITDNKVVLPIDYMFYLKAEVLMNKTTCGDRKARLVIRQHNDKFEESPFDCSSYEWKVVNGLFTDGNIQLFDDGSFTNTSIELSYIKKPKYIHNAKAFGTGIYRLPSGVVLGRDKDNAQDTNPETVDCELPEHTHREIVDIAVAMVSGELLSNDYQVKLSKLNINELK